MPESLLFSHSFPVSLEVLYRAFTTNEGLNSWLSNSSDLDVRPDGRYFLWSQQGFQSSGIFTEIKENEKVAGVVHAPHRGQFRISFSEESGGTRLEIEQSFESIGAADLEKQRQLWEQTLENLHSVVETGYDLRFYSRPMLGVLIADRVDADAQSRLGLPVDYGIIISGTVSKMGAEQLGLQGDDVLVKLAGVELRDYRALEQAVAPYKAGDTVELVWYRGGQKFTADLTLSGRPKPPLPGSPAELAEEVRQIYARLDAELAEIMDGVSEEEAEFRLQKDEWNAKEIIAHIIATERAVHLWMTITSNGQVFHHWASNDHLLVKSMVDIHPTVGHLMAELRRTEDQTVALLRRLPETIVEHKGVFHNIVATLNKNGLPLHTRNHYSTIESLIQAARRTNG